MIHTRKYVANPMVLKGVQAFSLVLTRESGAAVRSLSLIPPVEGIAIVCKSQVSFEDMLSPERLKSPDKNLQSFP